MSEIADAMRQLIHDRRAELDSSIDAELESRRGAVAEIDKELAQFHGRELSQADMVKFQAIVNKRNQAFEMMSQLLQKQQQAMNSIITNMR
jgi:hypothetical protein